MVVSSTDSSSETVSGVSLAGAGEGPLEDFAPLELHLYVVAE